MNDNNRAELGGAWFTGYEGDFKGLWAGCAGVDGLWEAKDMDRIVMLVQEKKNAGLMRDRLADNYQVLETEIDQSLDFSFDLGIVDESALKQTWEEVQSRREAAKPVFLPFLLVAARRNTALVTRHLWQTVDEIIWTPINHLELQTRVENLLRSRRLSLEAQRLTTADLITGVHNRRYFFTLGNRELNRARRFNRSSVGSHGGGGSFSGHLRQL